MSISIKSGEIKTEDYTIKNQQPIRVDNVAFDEKSMMTIHDHTGRVIAYYDRFDNKSGTIRGATLFSAGKTLLYSFVPLLDNNTQLIHIKDKEDRRGKITIDVEREGLMSMSFKIDLEMFGRPYILLMSMEIKPVEYAFDYIIQYEKTTVLTKRCFGSAESTAMKTEMYVHPEHFQAHQDECAMWVINLLLLDEINRELQHKMRSEQRRSSDSPSSPVHNPTPVRPQ
jgi:hypothetical protein